MLQGFPSLIEIQAISRAHDHTVNFDLVVIGITVERRLYVAASQNQEGEWYVPDSSHNPLAGQEETFVAAPIARSGNNNLQIVGLGADGRLSLAAWQDFLRWHIVPSNTDPLSKQKQRFISVAMSLSSKDNLQIVGINTDGLLSLAAWQDLSGHWHIPNDNPFDKQRQSFTAIFMAGSGKGNLQVIGLDVDGRLSLAGWQDGSGHWHIPDNNPLIKQTQRFILVKMAQSSHGHLQIIGKRRDGRLSLAAWQDSDGHWHIPDDDPLGDQTRVCETFALGRGSDNLLQVIGATPTDGLHLIAWQDASGHWHRPDTLLSNETFSHLATANGNSKFLQVLGLDASGALYLAAWQDDSGRWHRGHRLSPDAHGPWNPKLPDVVAAVQAVRDHGNARLFHGEPLIPNMVQSHVQGVAPYGDYFILSHNNKGYSRGRILILSQKAGALIQQFSSPIENFNHPGGCQAIGDYLALAIENSSGNHGFVVFYDLGVMSHNIEPGLLPIRIEHDQGVGGVGITNYSIDAGPELYLAAVLSGGNVTFYVGNGKPLSDPACAFRRSSAAQLSEGGGSEACLVTSQHNIPYLIVFRDEVNSSQSYNDYFDVYRVDPRDHSLKYLLTRHMYTDRPTPAGVHFRWGGGLQILRGEALQLYACQRNFVGNRFDLDVFAPSGDGLQDASTPAR